MPSSSISYSAFNSVFITSIAIFLSESELSVNPEIFDLSTNPFLYIKFFNRKFIAIRCGEIFSLNFWYFCILISFLTRSLTLGILFSTALRAATLAKPVILGVLSSISVILALHSVFLQFNLVSNFFLSIWVSSAILSF